MSAEVISTSLLKRRTCRECGRQFTTINSRKRHESDKHYRTDREPSMASLFIEGEMNRAMGIRNEDWLEEMLP